MLLYINTHSLQRKEQREINKCMYLVKLWKSTGYRTPILPYVIHQMLEFKEGDEYIKDRIQKPFKGFKRFSIFFSQIFNSGRHCIYLVCGFVIMLDKLYRCSIMLILMLWSFVINFYNTIVKYLLDFNGSIFRLIDH